MGNSGTFENFLKWGVESFPAAKMGLIFWNHGGGSITGVCFDEKNDYDSLSLTEIDSALNSVSDNMTDKFEFIGFDACLMGTIESANTLASYSRYMYGSQETEPGYGWDYLTVGNYLGTNPNADGAELGKVICDSFYECCEQIGEESGATLSCIDLSQIDGVITSFNDFSQEIYNATNDKSALSLVVRNVKSADNFGGNNKSEGYTNMVDMAGVVNAGSPYSDSRNKVLSAIDKAVVYTRNGSDHENACGLSIYYPLKIEGSSELKIFGDIAISPYYLSLVDRAAYSTSTDDTAEEYDNSSVMDMWSNQMDGNESDGGESYDDY